MIMVGLELELQYSTSKKQAKAAFCLRGAGPPHLLKSGRCLHSFGLPLQCLYPRFVYIGSDFRARWLDYCMSSLAKRELSYSTSQLIPVQACD